MRQDLTAAQERLRESEARFKNIADAAPVMIWVAGPDKGCTYFNQVWLAFTGRIMAQELGNGWAGNVHPEDVARCWDIYSSSFDARSSFQMEYRLRRADGEYRWLLDNGVPRYDSGGVFVGYIGSCIDITERQRGNDYFRMAVESAPNAMVMVNHEGTILLVNSETERLFGYERQELLGKSVEILLPEPQRHSHPALRESFFAQPRVRPLGAGRDLYAQRKDGTHFPVEIGLNSVNTEEGTWVLSSIADISRRKQAEAALLESEERFRNMADTAPVMIWVSGLDKLCTFFNKVWLEFTGSVMDEALGTGWSTKVHPDDRYQCYVNYSSAFDARRTFQTECRLRRADGEYRYVLTTGTPRFESGDVFVGYIGSSLDITDLKLTHEEDLARKKMETVGALAGGIAHDFNNLLGGVLANAELALAELTSGTQPLEEIRKIQDAAIRGAGIVRQLMIYAGEERAIVEPVNMSEIVDDMLALLKVSVSKHVSWETTFGKDVTAIHANPSQIRQIVMNLITNASEAIGDRKGVIRVFTRRVTVGRGSPLAASLDLVPGDYVQLEVSDTGRGMTPEVQARVFDPFFTTKPTGSHGIGLAVVRRIVLSLHGAIQLSSVPGDGATFQIFLPCEEHLTETTRSAIVRQEDSTVVSRPATILVVEDENLLREGVSKMLRKRGWSVIEASDGSAALDVIRASNHIDVLFLDITLPGASSRAVYEEAKRIRPGLPVIVTSAKSEEMAAKSLGRSGERFIRKPFRVSSLIDVIQEALSF